MKTYLSSSQVIEDDVDHKWPENEKNQGFCWNKGFPPGRLRSGCRILVIIKKALHVQISYLQNSTTLYHWKHSTEHLLCQVVWRAIKIKLTQVLCELSNHVSFKIVKTIVVPSRLRIRQTIWARFACLHEIILLYGDRKTLPINFRTNICKISWIYGYFKDNAY